MRLRTTALIIVLSMLVMLFTGCGSNHKENTTTRRMNLLYRIKGRQCIYRKQGDTVLEGEYEIEGEDIT